MRERVGETFSIAIDNAPVPGCTVSREICGDPNGVSYFSLARGTDISAEIHPHRKLIVVAGGVLEVHGANGLKRVLEAGDSIFTPPGEAVGMRTAVGAIYTEIRVRKEDVVSEAIRAGEVFELAELVPYAESRIVNMDVVHNEKMKFVVMAFDEGTGLEQHAAPGEALVFALDGEATIGYEGKDHVIKAGECFHFAKGGLHCVKATGRFKMALLLTLE